MTNLPQDKDQYTISDKAIRQTQCKTKFANNAVLVDIKIKGQAAELVELGGKYREGQVVPVATLTGKYPVLGSLPTGSLETVGTVKDCEVVFEEGIYATFNLRINVPFDGLVVPDENEPSEKKIVTWHERSCQYQYPIERYAGKTDATEDDDLANTDNPDAGVFESWKNENGQSATNYRAYKTNIDGTDWELKGKTLDLAKKAYAGVQAVERYYPEVSRITQYKWVKGDEEEVQKSIIDHIDEDPALSEIDTGPDAVWSGKFPNTSWLKVGYDVQTATTSLEGFWDVTVTETWRGVDKTDNPRGWDSNLYGARGGQDRWAFYDEPVANNNQNNNQNT